VVTVLTTEVVVGRTAVVGRGALLSGIVGGSVVLESAAFFVRGLADGGGLGLDGEAWCAWAAPAATSPPLRRASANEAARTGRRFDISGPYAFGPNARAM
jgi:hypothetical protein